MKCDSGRTFCFGQFLYLLLTYHCYTKPRMSNLLIRRAYTWNRLACSKSKISQNNFFKAYQLNEVKYHSNIKEGKTVTVDQINNIRIICINRPEKRNCVNASTAELLLQAFKDFDDDEKSKVAVLHGAGGNFCSGYDLNELSTASIDNELPTLNGPMGPSRYETKKPVIAAVEGYAVAGGLELALWCDIRIVEETAVMGVFCRRFGVPLIDGGTYRLPAIVGLGRALDIIMTGRQIKAEEALQIGLANQICACGSALGRAIFYAQGLAKHPFEALKADRTSTRQFSSFKSIEDALNNEHQNGLKALKEAQIGAKRFSKGEGRHGAKVSSNNEENDSTFIS